MRKEVMNLEKSLEEYEEEFGRKKVKGEMI